MQSVHESLDRPHVELLIALDASGQLRQAAESLHLSSSAASHRLKEAERRLGVPLTEVAGRSIRLTAAARHIVEIGTTAHRAMRSAEETARWMASADRPAVRIAMDFYDTGPWFEQLIGDSSLPCDLDFIRVGYGEALGAVASRRVDLGVVVKPVGVEDRSVDESQTICRDELVGIVRADDRAAQRGTLDPSDVADATYLTAGDRPSHGFEHHEFFEPAGIRPRRLRKVESLEMVLRLIRRFGGVTVQPAKAIESAFLDGLAIVPLRNTLIEVAWSTVLRPDPSENEDAIAAAIHRLVNDAPLPNQSEK